MSEFGGLRKHEKKESMHWKVIAELALRTTSLQLCWYKCASECVRSMWVCVLRHIVWVWCCGVEGVVQVRSSQAKERPAIPVDQGDNTCLFAAADKTSTPQLTHATNRAQWARTAKRASKRHTQIVPLNLLNQQNLCFLGIHQLQISQRVHKGLNHIRSQIITWTIMLQIKSN